MGVQHLDEESNTGTTAKHEVIKNSASIFFVFPFSFKEFMFPLVFATP